MSKKLQMAGDATKWEPPKMAAARVAVEEALRRTKWNQPVGMATVVIDYYLFKDYEMEAKDRGTLREILEGIADEAFRGGDDRAKPMFKRDLGALVGDALAPYGEHLDDTFFDRELMSRMKK